MLTKSFESNATNEQIIKFKKKYSGIQWQTTIEKTLMNYADSTLLMKRWIGNIISFVSEHNIAVIDS
ncbi:MAG: hypothetical protein A2W22_01965 [Candidatus Levybacteria bacterium RBG_16_35_11]|nr:MAG: hypothetical protein A2W22_01965 [Candidatus Levybacteria bacterium RBG_16_35_11]